ncbi:methyltransferase-like protein 23-like isoform X2 [Hibiscus syriacus]|uniref:Methyltransferase-like protein 23-like isoform X2 n=1 Tax=Hibiscus syriacus TaxID=106335 RepID=A0A6A2Z5S7_HIBSY|nr:methyltransferase-like protein 23-like isoform X2 [Hibiscus syriacus]
MKEDYGLFVWPCSIVLAEYVWQQRSRFSGNDVVEVLGLTWGSWDESIFSLLPKIILGADVLYDARAFDDLFATVTFLFQNNPGSVFITTYHNRSGHHLIEFLMVKWGLKCVKLVDGFSLLPSDKAARLSGNIQLAEIVLSHEQIEETSSSGAR